MLNKIILAIILLLFAVEQLCSSPGQSTCLFKALNINVNSHKCSLFLYNNNSNKSFYMSIVNFNDPFYIDNLNQSISSINRRNIIKRNIKESNLREAKERELAALSSTNLNQRPRLTQGDIEALIQGRLSEPIKELLEVAYEKATKECELNGVKLIEEKSKWIEHNRHEAHRTTREWFKKTQVVEEIEELLQINIESRREYLRATKHLRPRS